MELEKVLDLFYWLRIDNSVYRFSYWNSGGNVMECNDSAIVEVLLENVRMRKALKRIAEWDLPEEKCRDGSCMVPYECNHGINGARDYVKQLAKEALEG